MRQSVSAGDYARLDEISQRTHVLQTELAALDAETWDLLGMDGDDELREQADLVTEFITNGLSPDDLLKALEIRTQS